MHTHKLRDLLLCCLSLTSLHLSYVLYSAVDRKVLGVCLACLANPESALPAHWCTYLRGWAFRELARWGIPFPLCKEEPYRFKWGEHHLCYGKPERMHGRSSHSQKDTRQRIHFKTIVNNKKKNVVRWYWRRWFRKYPSKWITSVWSREGLSFVLILANVCEMQWLRH